MSLSSLLSIARTALFAQRRAMEVTAHNVANANTPGYTRQRLELTAADPLRLPMGTVGRGVEANTILRLRDRFYDLAFRRDNAQLGGSSTRLAFMEKVEGAIGEPSDTGISAALDGMFQSFSDLTHDPAGAAPRELVRQAASRLARGIRTLDGRLAQASQDAIQRLNSDVADVNSIAGRIASLNSEILAAGGERAPDLLDERDRLVDQLSEYATLQVVDHGDGTVSVIAGNVPLVDGSTAQTLQAVPLGAGFAIANSAGAVVQTGAGRLEALTSFLTTELPGVRIQFDQFVSSLVAEVNTLHAGGITLTGATGVAFFDPAGVTAGTLSLSAAVTASTDAIAAGLTNAPGDADVALQLAQLRDGAVAALGGRTLGEFYTTLAGAVGSSARDAGMDVDTHTTLVGHADVQRQAVSGVSVDEEMLTLIGQQEAYGAAARLVQAAQEMADTVLKMV